jgi:hypothetical protein
MSAVLPSATTTVVRGQGAIATGLDLATFWGCVTKNADMVPRLWFDANALEVFHGAGQVLDQISLFIRITGLPVLLVPLPCSAPGIIRTQIQMGTGTSAATVGVGSDGSLERVDGLARVVQGGAVGVDQIQAEYSLDGGSVWTLFRLGTASSYAIPRTGQVLSFAPGTLVEDEEVLSWTSSAPTPADADITTGRENLAAQGEQSRSWYLIRELEQETDIAQLSAELENYDSSGATPAQRPLQAYAGIRRAYDRSGYKAQMSRTRSWMQGDPEITFTQGAGPPNDTITRDAGSFVADGFADWSLGNGDWITVSGASEAGNNGSWKLSAADTLIITLDVAGALTTDVDASGVSIWTTMGLEFVDGGGGDDTLVRGRGSWIDEGFEVGDIFTVVGTVSNDGDYPITDLTADTITVATGSFVAEEISSWGVTITASVLYPIDAAAMDAEFAPTLGQYKLELSYGHYWNASPAYGARLRYPVALVDMTRSYLIDVSETTWWEEQPGPLSRGEEGWKGIDKDGQPFEYDERIHRRALPASFTCGRTGPNTGSNTYIARALTRAGGSDALTQSHVARVTNAARIIVQRKTQALTGRTFITTRPDAQGRQFLQPRAISVIEGSVNGELARQLLGTTRRGEDARVSAVSWVAARDDDFSVQNPILHGTLTVQSRKAIVTIDTAVEVI